MVNKDLNYSPQKFSILYWGFLIFVVYYNFRKELENIYFKNKWYIR